VYNRKVAEYNQAQDRYADDLRQAQQAVASLQAQMRSREASLRFAVAGLESSFRNAFAESRAAYDMQLGKHQMEIEALNRLIAQFNQKLRAWGEPVQ
jgi:chromosome segregation ATPase